MACLTSLLTLGILSRPSEVRDTGGPPSLPGIYVVGNLNPGPLTLVVNSETSELSLQPYFRSFDR